ncbi:MAG: hypothetical protein HQK54_11030 [Oligoflexales bacterium]|nr:hypothetical protein [Oligoflexales bacterium]
MLYLIKKIFPNNIYSLKYVTSGMLKSLYGSSYRSETKASATDLPYCDSSKSYANPIRIFFDQFFQKLLRVKGIVRYLICSLIPLTLLKAFYTGFRFPNSWSTNYYQVNWFDGFRRRAVVGTFLYPLGCRLFDYSLIACIQFAVLAMAISCLLYFSIKSKQFILPVTYFLSAAGGYLFHEVGYIDQLLWLFAGIIIYAIGKNRLCLAYFLLFISVFIHEMALFIVLPLVLAYMIAIRRCELSSLVRMSIFPVLAFIGISFGFSNLPSETANRYLHAVYTCGYRLMRPEYLDIFKNNYSQKVAMMYYSKEQIISIIFPFIILTYSLVSSFSKKTHMTKVNQFILGICCLLPLVNGVFGFDTDRWIFLTFTQIILIYIMFSLKADLSEEKKSPLLQNRFYIALFIVALQLHLFYFDGYVPRPLTYNHLTTFGDYITQLSRNLPPRR